MIVADRRLEQVFGLGNGRMKVIFEPRMSSCHVDTCKALIGSDYQFASQFASIVDMFIFKT